MAKRKKTRSRRRGMGGHTAPRRRRSRRRGGLSEVFNATKAFNAGKTTLMSGAGGFGAVIVTNNILPKTAGKMTKVLTGLAAGFLISYFGGESIGSGFSGGMTALAFPQGLLNEGDANFADENSLADNAPIFLDKDGEPMTLEEGEDGASMRYLTEAEKKMVDWQDAQYA